MRRNLGAACISCVVAIVSGAGLAGGTYMVMSGTTPCSLLCCPSEKTAAKNPEVAVKNASAKEASTEKAAGCCALKALAAKAKSGECTASKSSCHSQGFIVMGSSTPLVMPAMFFDSSATFSKADFVSGGCGGHAKSSCSSAKTVAASAKESSGCCKAKAATAKSGCSAPAAEQAKTEEKPAEQKSEPVASRN